MLPSALDYALQAIGQREAHNVSFQSDAEYAAVLSALKEAGSTPLVNSYIELLARNPTDAQNPDKERVLQASMDKLRSDFFQQMDISNAHVALKFPAWRQQFTQLTAHALETMMRSACEAKTSGPVDSLYGAPTYWNQRQKELAFLQFSDLRSFLSESELLSICMPFAQATLANASLQELLSAHNSQDWYGHMLDNLVAKRISTDAPALIESCRSRKQAEDLYACVQAIAPNSSILKGFAFVLAHTARDPIAKLLNELSSLPSDAADAARHLLLSAAFDIPQVGWESWRTEEITFSVPLAAACWLDIVEPDWSSFFDKTLTDSTDAENVARQVLYISRVLYAYHIHADELVFKLSAYRPSVYSMLRGLGLKRAALKPLLNPSTWEGLGAPDNLHELLFTC